ncbi:ankyrin repeat-containing domain protein [Aspergillus insuetus]
MFGLLWAAQTQNGLLDLPLGILLHILDELATEANINTLAKTCRQSYILLDPVLYQRNIQNGRSSALLWAVREYQEATVLRCLEQDASISFPPPERTVSDASDSDDDDSEYGAAACALRPLVCVAAEKGYDSILRILLEHGANLNGENWYPHLPLSLAIQDLQDAAMHLLLDHADIELNPTEARYAVTPPLFFALMRDSLEIVRDLINRGAHVDLAASQYRVGSLSWRALSIAAAPGSRPLMELLIQHGGCHPKERRNAVFHQAARFGHWHLFKYFVALGADPNSTDYSDNGATAISIPARRGQSDGVNALIACGTKTDIPNENGETPLACAAAAGHARIVEILLDKGAEPNFEDAQGRTPVYRAASSGSIAVLEALLIHGGFSTSKTHGNKSPLSEAAEKGHVECVQRLLSLGAPFDQPSIKSGQTPLSRAAEHGHYPVIELLLEHGANMDATDHEGRNRWTGH